MRILFLALGFGSTKVFAQVSDTLSAAPVEVVEIVETAPLTENAWGRRQHLRTADGFQISPAEITASQSVNTAALLENHGVFVQRSQWGGGSPVLRGFEANKILLVVDGVRMNNAIFRGGHLQNVLGVDVNLLEHVAIDLGPRALAYGSDALGGAIRLQTRRPAYQNTDRTVLNGRAKLQYQSAAHSAGGHLELNIGRRKFAALSSLSFTQLGDLRSGSWRGLHWPAEFGARPAYQARLNGQDTALANPRPNRQVASGYWQLDATHKLRWQPHPQVEHGLNFQYSTTSDVPRYDRLARTRDDTFQHAEWYYGPQRRGLAAYRLNWAGKGKNLQHVGLNANYSYYTESRNTRAWQSEWRNERQEQVHVPQTQLWARWQFGSQHGFTTGADAQANWVVSTAARVAVDSAATEALDTRYPDGGSQMTLAGAFFEYRFQRTKWRLSLGGRIQYTRLYARFTTREFYPFLPDKIEQTHLAGAGGLMVQYNFHAKHALTARIHTGFRAPNVDDLAKVFDSQPGQVIIPNPNAEPEYTATGEFLYQLTSQKLNFSATVFTTGYLNALVIQPATTEAGADSLVFEGVPSEIVQVVNASRAVILGGRLAVNYHIIPAVAFHVEVHSTYGQDLFFDTPLGHIPPLYGRLGVEWAPKEIPVRLALYAIYNGQKRIERYSNTGEDNPQAATPSGMPAWGTLNFRAVYTPNSRWRMVFNLENFTDMHYRTFMSGISNPGINASLAIEVRF